MFTMCYTRFSITDLSLFRKSELRDEGGNKMGKIMAVNISEKKGTQKKNVHSARLMEEFGIEKDAHAGKWHRQVSLLSYEKIQKFREKGADVALGAFGENLIIEGYDFRDLPVGTRFRIGDAILEMTDMRVRKGNRVDEIVLNLEAAGYLQSIFEKLREKNRTNYEIYVSVTLYDIPTRLVARHYHITALLFYAFLLHLYT